MMLTSSRLISIPASRIFDRGAAPHRLVRLALLAGLALTLGQAAPQPDYLRTALAAFNPAVPSGWAYTQITTQNKITITERYDPAKPAAEQWTLIQHNGQPPTAKELSQYLPFKAAQASSLTQTVFSPSDIEPASLELLRENAARAVYTGRFRVAATAADKMLGHLQLQLTVNKQHSQIERVTLELLAPYSPVLGVKMNELTVTMDFALATAERPSLPTARTSHFSGRIMFFGNEENVHVIYDAYQQTPPPTGTKR